MRSWVLVLAFWVWEGSYMSHGVWVWRRLFWKKTDEFDALHFENL